MRAPSTSRSRSRRLALLLFIVTVPSTATLLWLGATINYQDKQLLANLREKQRDVAMRGIVGSLEQSLLEAERHLGAGRVPEGMVRLRVTSGVVEAEPADALAWYPQLSQAPVLDAAFHEAEALEFSGRTLEALARYRQQSESGDVATRTGAIFRQARIHQREGRFEEALLLYRQSVGDPAVMIAGAPADLQRRRRICDVLARTQRAGELRREAELLERDLISATWRLDRAAWQLVSEDLARWLDRRLPIDHSRLVASAAAQALIDGVAAPAGRQTSRLTLPVENGVVTAIVRGNEDGTTALLITPTVVNGWLRVAAASMTDIASLELDASQPPPAPSADQSGDHVRMPSAASGLPWPLVVTRTPGDTIATDQSARSLTLASGLAAIVMLVGGSGLLLWRVVHREGEVAKLQTEFVATVSHEFRTPLTSLRHMTELLNESEQLPAERRKTFYQALERNTRRLQLLVEALLDFSRLEGARRPFSPQTLDAASLVKDVVSEFRTAVDRSDIQVDVEIEGAAADLRVHADPGSLARVVWNLLDNAVKYSPERALVHVHVRRDVNDVFIAIRDHGLGVPAAERDEIFGKFVRGHEARRRGIRGTGLGLAMVAHIVQAHGGSVKLRSEEGHGSEFSILLPAAEGR